MNDHTTKLDKYLPLLESSDLNETEKQELIQSLYDALDQLVDLEI